MKKKYFAPKIMVEMFDIETTILEGSWVDKDDNNTGNNGDHIESNRRPGYERRGFSDPKFGSLW